MGIEEEIAKAVNEAEDLQLEKPDERDRDKVYALFDKFVSLSENCASQIMKYFLEINEITKGIIEWEYCKDEDRLVPQLSEEYCW